MAAVSSTPLVASFGAVHARVALVVETRGSRKVVERVVTNLRKNRRDARAVGGALRRLNNHSKAMQIQILLQLLDEQDWELALPMYQSLREQVWYQWNPSPHARLMALLVVARQSQKFEALALGTTGQLSYQDDVNLQVCLIENYAKCGLLEQSLTAFQNLQSHSLPSARYLSYGALLRAYGSLGLPHEAYLALGEMKSKGINPRLDDYKAVIHGFGKGGHLVDMEKLVQELHEAGLKLDRSGFNIILSAYGQAQKFHCITETLEQMHSLNMPCSINSRNAISKACPSLVSLFDVLEELPVTAASLLWSLELRGTPDGELQGVKELLSLGLSLESVKWTHNVWELDLHHMFIGTADIALFLWLGQIRERCISGVDFPLEVRVVTGWGKHSDVRGKAAVKEKVFALLQRIKSPFKADNQNRGAIVSRGSLLMVWLSAGFNQRVS